MRGKAKAKWKDGMVLRGTQSRPGSVFRACLEEDASIELRFVLNEETAVAYFSSISQRKSGS